MWSSLRMIVEYALLTADNSDALFNKNDIHAISNIKLKTRFVYPVLDLFFM